MTKDSGLGDRLYVGGVDVSGDIGSLNEASGGPAALDVTHIMKSAAERVGTVLSGMVVFDAFHNSTRAHTVFSPLPTSDVIATYLHNSGMLGLGIVARQLDYPGRRADDGSLHYTITCLSDGAGLEWGNGYVGGNSRTDTTATTGAGIDDTWGTNSGAAAYLQGLVFTGTSVTVTVQHSNDNGATDPYTSIITFAAVTAAPNAQRVTTSVAASIKRWIRVVTAGTFSVFTFHVLLYRGVDPVVIVAVDVQLFTSSGTWTKPAGGQNATYVVLVGGGGGGGGGYSIGGGSDLSGGSGGGGGGYTSNLFRTTDLSATETVTVGAGGAGGIPFGGGTGGGVSSFGTTVRVRSAGSGAGAPGNVGILAPGGIGGIAAATGQAGGDSPLAGNGATPATNWPMGACGGGGGGGLTAAAGTKSGGGGGGTAQLVGGRGTSGAAGGSSGGNATGAPTNAPVGAQGGGGGGSANGVTDAGNGGNGGIPGGGGGGGGSAENGNPGTGGNGGRGVVVVVSW